LKIVTNDYGCGTSSSILDYGIKDVVVVSENNYQHVFEQDDDLLFIGHDFLFYLWDSEEKIKKWMSYAQKRELWLWCFERVDAIVPEWKKKSHVSIAIASKFCKRILACDEDDCDNYGFDWLPQWASKKFYENRHLKTTSKKVLFSGQAGGAEYHIRNSLLSKIFEDNELSRLVEVTNTKRSLDWQSYVNNLLKYESVLNPVGILRGLNTRAFETIYSGRKLFQHTFGSYRRHENLLKDCPHAVFFKDIEEFRTSLKNLENLNFQTKDLGEEAYKKHSLYARMKSIGLEIS
jgi:hypothetical protein